MTARLGKPFVDESAKRARDQRIRRTNKRKQGYILKQIWVKPEDWERIQRYLRNFH